MINRKFKNIHVVAKRKLRKIIDKIDNNDVIMVTAFRGFTSFRIGDVSVTVSRIEMEREKYNTL